MTVEFPTPLVVCDIGGTNTRIAVVTERGGLPKLLAKVRTADFPDFEAAVASVLEAAGVRPATLVACGAGPVEGRHLTLTNAAWRLDGPAIAQRFGLAQGLLLNDFEAQALSLPVIRPDQALSIGPDLPTGSGPRLVLGPGTGLGVAALLEISGRFVALPSEAGHIDIGPVGPEEEELWPRIERFHGRMTAETLLSGHGLERLHAARTGAPIRPEDRHAAAITTAAVRKPSGHEADSVRQFWRLAGRFAGDMAITFSATGGVTLAGGILPRLSGLLDAATFRAAFCHKEPVADLARRIGTRLLIAPDAVLDGMAAIAFDPARYAIDYTSRAWR